MSVVSPPGASLPLAGMKAINEYAIMRGQELQRDLIGCAELPILTGHKSFSRLYTTRAHKNVADAALARRMTAQAEVPVEAYSTRLAEAKDTLAAEGDNTV